MTSRRARPVAPERSTQRVLIVDDSAVARAVLTRMVADTAGCSVAAAVPDVPSALAFLAAEMVDVILLDLEMPGIDGLTAMPDLLAAGAGAKVLVVSSIAGDGAAVTVEALALGAADTLVKPGHYVTAGCFARALAEKLARLGERTEPVAPLLTRGGASPRDFDVVAIGASTGGIHALTSLFQALPPSFTAPIAVTQHLPAAFMPHFARQMAAATGRRCEIASDRLVPANNMIVIAPGDAHLVATPLPTGGAAMRLSRTPVPNGNLPSVDPMFETLAECFGPRLLAIVLSGMGRDGLQGAARVRQRGGTLVVQDQASSVVWGMPGAVVRAGLADAVLSPEEIGRFVGQYQVAAA